MPNGLCWSHSCRRLRRLVARANSCCGGLWRRASICCAGRYPARLGAARGRRPRAGAAAVVHLADVAFDEAQARLLRGADQVGHFVRVALVMGGKVIQARHVLIEQKQGFEQVAANESDDACDEPGFWLLQVG